MTRRLSNLRYLNPNYPHLVKEAQQILARSETEVLS